MMPRRTTALVVTLGLAACRDAAPARPIPIDETPNTFLSKSPLTFVVGTLGDDRCDRITLAQARMVAELFPRARVARDDDVVEPGAARIVYGGPHVNAFVRDRRASLPFELGPGRLVIGGRTFEGDDVRIIAVVPGDPSFLLYAGTGTPGVAEINAVRHGEEPIVIADTFGRLVTGRWERAPDGVIRAVLDAPARRIGWRDVSREVARGIVRFRFPTMVPASPDEAALIDACLGGIDRAADRLALTRFDLIDVYVYPDARSKQTLTGDPGDGHAVVAARALHVVAFPPEAIVPLMAHEATHVLALDAWGPAGMPLIGEGLAVWVAGAYGGVPLSRLTLPAVDRRVMGALLGRGFRDVPERIGYTYGGHLVAAAIALVGIEGVRDHLYGATAATWPDALRAAGLDPDALARAIDRRLTPTPESDK